MHRSTLRLFVYCIVLFVGSASLLQAHSTPNRLQAVIFDCDGVLVDTEHLKFLAWKEALEAQGVPFSIEEYMPLVGHSSKNILQMIQEAKGISISEEVIAAKNEHYTHLQKQGVSSIAHMVHFALFLFEWKKPLGIQLAVASSAPKEEILANLEQIGLKHVFDLIISGSDDLQDYIDSDGTNKPKPYIYIESAKQLRIPPECCLVFEDTKAGVDAAASAGMVVIAVPNRFTQTHDFSNAHRVINGWTAVCKQL